MSSDQQPGDLDTVDFTPWPRPVPNKVLSGAKKVLLVLIILIGLQQLLPSASLWSSLSNIFTLLVVMSWLGPLTRVLASKPWGRKTGGEREPEV